MTIAGALALYFIIWWTVLFITLPFGSHSQAEAGDVTAGTDPGAPVRPDMKRKALWTTIIAGVLFGIVWMLLDVIKL
jgi:predicted secreted protein